MKVGTDGVLLGAWVNPKSYPHQILDVEVRSCNYVSTTLYGSQLCY